MRSIVAVVLLAALAAGCKKEENKGTATAPATAPAAPGPAAAAIPMPQPAQAAPAMPAMPGTPGMPGAPGQPNMGAALQQGMAALANALGGQGNQAAGPIVNWKALEPFLPEKLGDWVATGPVKGQTGGFGAMQVSTVNRSYKNGDRSVRVKIADTNAAALMRMPFQLIANMNIDSSEGVKKGVTIAGQKGYVDWKKAGSSKAAALVGERFVVEARLSQAQSVDEVVGVVGAINLGGLAAVK